MTRPLRSSSDAPGYTRLERAVAQALAWDLRDQVPDLANQFASGRPTLRRNSGFGLFTEISSPSPMWGGTAAQPPGWGSSARSQATGDLGTVHAMIAGLADPVAFSARLRDGRLLGLMGDSYGQDTRQIDFASVPFDQVFTLDASGRSIPFATSASSLPSPPQEQGRREAATVREAPGDRPVAARASQTPPRHVAVVRKPPIQRQAPSGLGSLQHTPLPAPVQALLRKAAQPAATPGTTPTLPTDRVSLLIGAWALIVVGALLAIWVFDVPWIFVLVAAFWIGGALRRPKAFDALRRGVQAWNANQASR